MVALPWLGTALQIIGAGGLASRLVRPVPAYWLMMGGSILWLDIAVFRGDMALAAMQFVFSALNLMGIVRWGKA